MIKIHAILLVLCFSALSASADDLKKITILQTSDIHSRTGTDSLPGIRQLASALNYARNNAGGSGKCLLVDCGDILQGSFAGSASRGAVGLGFLNELKYDVWIPGNHDFDFGTARFLDIMKQCSPAIVAANLYFDGKRLACPWKVIEKNGVRIAIIGMTSPSLDKWHWGKNSSGISSSLFSGPLDEIIPKVMESKCDIIILAVHQGLFQTDKSELNLNRIAEMYPQIDLVLGAHTHQPSPGETTGVSTWYAQPDAYCANFSLIKAEVDILKHKTVKIESQLVSVPASGTGHFKFSSSMENLLSSSYEKSRNEIISLKNEIMADELNKMTAESYFMSFPKAAYALIIPQARVVKPGKFSEDDLYWTFPFEDTLCSIELKDEDLKVVQDDVAKLKDGTMFDLVKSGNVSPAGRKNIVLSSYLFAGAGGRVRSLADFAKDPECHAADSGITLRDVFRSFLKKSSSR